MQLIDKAMACGYAIIDNDGLWDVVNISSKQANLVLERASAKEVSKFIASKARVNPALIARAAVATLPLPELDCDPDAYGEDD